MLAVVGIQKRHLCPGRNLDLVRNGKDAVRSGRGRSDRLSNYEALSDRDEHDLWRD